MKKYFRLYTDTKFDFKSSIFDLISGQRETKQTKGLAYIFSQYENFLFCFLELKAVKSQLLRILPNKLKFDEITSIEVSAERLTTDKKRADIVIKIDVKGIPFLAIIIEAKSINTNVNQASISCQISHYLDDNQFPDLNSYTKCGVVLTKYNHNIPNVINVTWENIIQLLFDFCKKAERSDVITQYFNFLTQIDNTMKYYEKEVLSIPAGRSLEMVQRFNIYVCPNTPNYNYKKSLFVTFRQAKGGTMDKLYKIEDIVILNPTNIGELEALRNSTYPDNFKNRLLEFISAANYQPPILNDERFYILSETESIDLVNRPKPQRNNAKFTYYTLKEVLTNQIVVPESQQ